MHDDVIDRLNAALEDRYLLECRIGEGGMADVYRADDLRHGRKVAIKVVRPEVGARLGAQRFLSEVRITARLQHPHILPLFDSGDADGLLYYVMPYVEGETLRRRLQRRGPLELDEALEVACHVGAALQHAHEHGVVHRDIKPENVMLQAGEAVVADFGIALALADAERTRLTAVGDSIGTPGYMSPEQASGEADVDERTDIYALGALLYEMLAGTPPFAGGSAREVVAKVLSGSRPPLRQLADDVPEEIAAAVERAMATRPADRFASVADLVARLQPPASTSRAGLSARAKLVAGAAAAFVTVAALGLVVQWRRVEAGRTWARTEAVPEIQLLLSEGDTFRALHLALEARQHLPDDPNIASLIDTASYHIERIESDPPGAQVLYRDYMSPSEWVELGPTPLEDVLVPDRHLVMRFALEGHRTHEQAFDPFQSERIRVKLASADEPEDMVAVPAGTFRLSREPVTLDAFRIDRREVTNRDFQAFVDAGAYGRLDGWAAGLGERAEEFDVDRARAELVDATGRPGPAGWELSRHPQGLGGYPVGGVSWFEAAAYCAHVGKSLPTFYHWKYAAGIEPWDSMIVASNFAGEGPVPAASSGAVGPYGTVDMAGNVREWVWNGTPEHSYILGSAWNLPTYLYVAYEAIDPWSREARNGFRCVRYDAPPTADLLEPIEAPYFDFTGVEPVDDETFAAYAGFYRYDPSELDAARDIVETTDDWVRERVEFDAAYPDERVVAHVFLPRNAEPPFQSVVFFPGADAFYLESSAHVAEVHLLEFIPRSGRALVFPVLKGHYERRVSAPRSQPATRRQLTVAQTQDIMRTVDYIVERPDLDDDAIAYMGISYGAELAVPVALEKRFAALVLVGAALDPAWRGSTLEEAAPWNFVSRITTPTIVINGLQDAMHPYEEGQVPFFEAVDVPPDDKRLIVSEAGHLPPPNEIIRHTLDWLDERLGPVSRTAR